MNKKPRHSGESRNPVVYVIHAHLGLPSGNDNKCLILTGLVRSDGTAIRFTLRPRLLDSGFRPSAKGQPE